MESTLSEAAWPLQEMCKARNNLGGGGGDALQNAAPVQVNKVPPSHVLQTVPQGILEMNCPLSHLLQAEVDTSDKEHDHNSVMQHIPLGHLRSDHLYQSEINFLSVLEPDVLLYYTTNVEKSVEEVDRIMNLTRANKAMWHDVRLSASERPHTIKTSRKPHSGLAEEMMTRRMCVRVL